MIAADVEEVGANDAEPVEHLLHRGWVLGLEAGADPRVYDRNATTRHTVVTAQVVGGRLRDGDQPIGPAGRGPGREFQVPARRAPVRSWLAAMPHIVDGDDRFQPERDGEDVAGNEGDVRTFPSKRLAQAPVRPQSRKWDAAPLHAGRQPRWPLDRIGIDAHRSLTFACGQGLDDASGVDLGPGRDPPHRRRAVDADDHRGLMVALASGKCRTGLPKGSRSISCLRRNRLRVWSTTPCTSCEDCARLASRLMSWSPLT